MEMISKNEFYDEDFGTVKVKLNSRARNIIFYNCSDGLHITVPPGLEEKKVREALNRFRVKLLHSRASCDKKLIDLNYCIGADFFKLKLSEGRYEKFMLRQERDRLELLCPPKTNFKEEPLQSRLHRVVEEALRKKAKAILPVRLRSLSLQYDFSFEQVKINSSKGRWGSCSSGKRINLSCYLLLLPAHLIDYVLLHELCHTKEMNHSKRFWQLMDAVTNGSALKLRKELKKYKTDFV